MNDDNAETRRFVESCYRTSTTLVNPIVDWTDEDVWSFLYHYGIKSNPLYEVADRDGTYCPMGNQRIGCIGCPMARKQGRTKEFLRYPKIRDNYLRAFDRMLKNREAKNKQYDWQHPWEVMMWWMEDNPDQLRFETPEYLKGAWSP